MARKYDFISELYNRTCKTVIANPESWEAFLRSACYNYRLRFDEQLLVHAQRPDATAVLQIDDWNQKFGRWVNRGAHGIAVFEDADQRRQRLVHYFDISDTHPSRFSRRVPIWQMRDEYTAEVIDTLESTFGELNDKETLAVAIESAARNAVEDNIPDYLSDLIYSVKDSFLDGVSEEEITHIFKKAVRNSVAYMTMTRLGIEAVKYFEPDDLRDVVNFTTPATLNALGYATSDIAEMGLAEISRTILALDRQNRIIAEKTKADYNIGKEKTERSPDDERDHLHEAGGLSAPQSDSAGAAGAVDGQVRPDAEEVPEGASQGTLLQPADELRPERASERHGAQSERAGTAADGADGSVGGRDGESESDGYDELGSEDEQYPEPGSGDRDGGGNLRLDYYDRSHEDKSLPFFGGDDTIREILGTTPHLKASKDEIRAFFEATADENARISYIKRIFNLSGMGVTTIQYELEKAGRLTALGKERWFASYISKMLRNSFYCGIITYHKEYTPDFLKQKKIKNYGDLEYVQVQGTHEPIITVEEYEQVQKLMDAKSAVLKNHSKGKRRTGRMQHTTVYGRLMICQCGNKFNLRFHSRDGRTDGVDYQCYTSVNRGSVAKRLNKGISIEHSCESPYIQGWKLEMMAEQVFDRYIENADKVMDLSYAMLEKHIADQEELPDNTDVIRRKQGEIEKLMNKRTNLIEMRAEGDIDKEMFRSKKQEIEDRVAKLTEEIKGLQPEKEQTSNEDYSVKLLELRERLKEYTGFDYSVIPESIVEAFIERIWVSKDEFRWYLRTGNNADGEFDPDDHIKIGAFTLTIDDAKKYIYSFSTRRRVYKWADLNVSVWI